MISSFASLARVDVEARRLLLHEGVVHDHNVVRIYTFERLERQLQTVLLVDVGARVLPGLTKLWTQQAFANDRDVLRTLQCTSR